MNIKIRFDLGVCVIKRVIILIFKEYIMAWTKPTISEISVGLEINSYACAEK